MTSIEDDINGQQQHWKTTSMEPKVKNTSIEEYSNGSQPQWKPYRKQMTLACLAKQILTELGPPQPHFFSFSFPKYVKTFVVVVRTLFKNIKQITK